jgi:thioredoxin-like negative regulator of GroEL
MPILEKLAFEYRETIDFIKTKANENIELVKQLGVASVPTLIIVNKDKEIERTKGVITEKSLRSKIEAIIK